MFDKTGKKIQESDILLFDIGNETRILSIKVKERRCWK
jgi:hypothetical protein